MAGGQFPVHIADGNPVGLQHDQGVKEQIGHLVDNFLALGVLAGEVGLRSGTFLSDYVTEASKRGSPVARPCARPGLTWGLNGLKERETWAP